MADSGATMGSNPEENGVVPSVCALFDPAGGADLSTAHENAASRNAAQEQGTEAPQDAKPGESVASATSNAGANGEQSASDDGEQDKCHQVYLCFDHDEALIYVGISWSAAARMSQHKRGKAWWPEVARIELRNVESREDAERLEQALIGSKHPKYNKRHRLNRAGAPTEVCDECYSSMYWLLAGDLFTVWNGRIYLGRWTCDTCFDYDMEKEPPEEAFLTLYMGEELDAETVWSGVLWDLSLMRKQTGWTIDALEQAP